MTTGVEDGDGGSCGHEDGENWKRLAEILEGGLVSYGGNRAEEPLAETHHFCFCLWELVCQRPVRRLPRGSEFGSRASAYGLNIHVNYFCKALAAYREELLLCLALEGSVLALWG